VQSHGFKFCGSADVQVEEFVYLHNNCTVDSLSAAVIGAEFVFYLVVWMW
jgi:hypothetical protein